MFLVEIRLNPLDLSSPGWPPQRALEVVQNDQPVRTKLFQRIQPSDQ
jgi:hypothetical protein